MDSWSAEVELMYLDDLDWKNGSWCLSCWHDQKEPFRSGDKDSSRKWIEYKNSRTSVVGKSAKERKMNLQLNNSENE